MRDYEQSDSERRNGGNGYTVKQLAKIRSEEVASELSQTISNERNKARLEKYGNSGPFRNLGSDDRANGRVYNNTGVTDSEIKSYTAGYYINGEKRISARLDKLTPEERYSVGEYEHDVLGITLDQLNLLRNNNDYMTGYMAAVIMNDNSKKHR